MGNLNACTCLKCTISSLDPQNKRSLDVIETAQLAFCLDSAHPHVSSLGPQADFQDPHYSIVANRVLHGNGSIHNSCNRWNDSSVQVSWIVVGVKYWIDSRNVDMVS